MRMGVETVVIMVVLMLPMVSVVGVGVVEEQVLGPALVVPALLLLVVLVGVVAAFTMHRAPTVVVPVLAGTVLLAPTVRAVTMVLVEAQTPPVTGVIAPILVPAMEEEEVGVVHMVTPT
jgi:hypothetical protein